MKLFWGVLLAALLSCRAPVLAQSDASVDLRVHNGQMELVFTDGIPPGERLLVEGRAQSLPLADGGGLALAPLDLPASALAADLAAGRSVAVSLSGPALSAQWTIEPLPRPALPLASAPAGDSSSAGTLAAGANGGMQAQLHYAGTGNNYVAFAVDKALPDDAAAVGIAYRLDPANAPAVVLSYRLADSRGEFYGSFLPTDNADAVQLISRSVSSFDYRFGGPPNADPAARLTRPLSLQSLVFDTRDHHQTGPARATLFSIFVIRRTRFAQTPSAPRPSIVSVDFARRIANVHSMSGFLHGASDMAPPDDTITPLHPALWRVGNEPPALRDRLARLGIPTVLVLSDNWGRKMPPPGSEWGNFVTGMARKAGGAAFTWDVLNEPDLAADYRETPEAFFPIFAQASDILHAEAGPNARVSGPSLSHYDRAYLTRFLDFCRAHHTRIDVLSWHELDVDADIPSVQDHLREARRLFADNPAFKALGIRQIQINEIVGPSAQYRPGEILGYFDVLEQGGADGACKACWSDSRGGSNCGNNSLDGVLTPDTHQPRAAWWAYKVYADTVAGRVAARSSDRSLAAFAASGEAERPSVVVGRFAYGDYARGPLPVIIRLQNLSRLPFVGAGKRVHVTVEKIPDLGEAALSALPTVLEQDVDVAQGMATVSLPPLALHEAYRLTLKKALSPERGL